VVIALSILDLRLFYLKSAAHFGMQTDENIDGDLDGIVEANERDSAICISFCLEVAVRMSNQFKRASHPGLEIVDLDHNWLGLVF
jgi:hypothetical protein